MAIDTLSLDFGRDKPFYVYLYRDPRPRKRLQPIYVGKGMAARKGADAHWLYGSTNRILNGILSKIRSAGLAPLIEIVAWFDLEADAFAFESTLITQFGRRNLGLGSLANMTDGGDGASNPSPEARAKMTATRTGRTATEETRARMSAARTGKKLGPLSEERRAAIGAVHRGKTVSEEARRKIGAAQLGRKMPRESVEKSAAARRGKKRGPHSVDARKKISEANFGKVLTLEHRAKIGAARAGKKHSAAALAKIKEAVKISSPLAAAATRACWADPAKRAARIAKMMAARARKKELKECPAA